MKLTTVFGLAIAIAFIGSVGFSPDAQGQGILRRLQSRVQARRSYMPPAPQNSATQRPTNPRPTYQPPTSTRQSANSSAVNSGSSPSLSAVAPRSNYRPLGTNVSPGTGSPSAVTPPAGASAGLQSPNSESSSTSGSTSRSGSLGGSILERGFEDDDERSTPAPGATQATLGIDVFETGIGEGLQVSGFRRESLADDRGVKVGDVILAINDQRVQAISDATKFLAGAKVGESLALRVRRGQQEASINVPLVEKVASDDEKAVVAKPPVQLKPTDVSVAPGTLSVPSDGMTIADLGITTVPSGQRGIQVAEVAPSSPAERGGIQAGDRLVSIDGRIVIDGDNLARELAQIKPGQTISTRMVRGSSLVQNQVTMSPKSAWPETSQVAKTDAKSQNPSLQDPSMADPSGSKSASVLSGFGSALGGLFGGASKTKSTPSTGKNAPESNVTQASVTGQARQPKIEIDEMDLGDVEPIQKSSYHEPLATPTIAPRPESRLQRDEMALDDEFALPDDIDGADPQSLQSIEPPAKLLDPVQAEIEQLERKLKALKAKSKD